MGLFSRIKRYIELRIAHSNWHNYVAYLRRKGVKIGENFYISGGTHDKNIDLSRPSLITIGDNVSINKNFTLMTHDFVSGLFRIKYYDFVPSSGRIVIGNNVRFGVNCTVLKGVTIGDNVFIAAGSIVTKDIPSNCIAGGCPCKPIVDLEIYYQKRKKDSVQEAFDYARSIHERFNRRPIPLDFWEEFPLFVDKSNINEYAQLPIKKQLGVAYEYWIENHKAPYKSFEEFLSAAGL